MSRLSSPVMLTNLSPRQDGTLPNPDSTDNPEFKIVLRLIRDGLAKNPQR